MKIPGIFITITGTGISGIASIILAYNSISVIYYLVVLGIIVTLIGAYLQYKESEIVKIRLDFIRDKNGYQYIFKIPFSRHKRQHPITTIQYENGSSGTLECMMAPSEILSDGTIIFTTKDLPRKDLYCLIK